MYDRMPPHHAAWLAAHPDRDKTWFLEMIAEGFQVHHLDGNHANDAPDNLVLIEWRDHRRLHGIAWNHDLDHGAAIRAGIEEARARGKQIGRKPVHADVEQAILALRQTGLGIQSIRRRLGIGASVVQRIVKAAA